MKTSTHKKLKKYAGIAAGIAISPTAFGQVLVTDLTPDVTINLPGNYPLDLDTNTVTDFLINVRTTTWQSTLATTYYNSATLVAVGTTAGSNSIKAYNFYNTPLMVSQAFARGLSYGATIGPSSTANSFWTSAPVGTSMGIKNLAGVANIRSSTMQGGQFLGADRYLGVRFQIGANTHYGWVRISATAGANAFTIKSYAYEATPDTPINAGFLTSSSTSPLEEHIVLSSENNNVIIDLKGIPAANVKLITSTGQVLASTRITEGTNEIATNGASGLCIVEITDDNAVIRKKVILN